MLGGQIRAMRRARKLSLQALADRIGLSKATLSRIETNQGGLRVGTLVAICEALDYELSLSFTPCEKTNA